METDFERIAGVARARSSEEAIQPVEPAARQVELDAEPALCADPGASFAEPVLREEAWAAGQAPGSGVVDGSFRGVFEYRRRRQPEPRWIHVEVQRDETLSEIADRFGVLPEEIASWNKLGKRSHGLRYGTRLRIRARKFPRYRSRLRYRVRAGDSWASVAADFGLEVRALRRFNPRKKSPVLRRGQLLTLWVESALPRWGSDWGSVRCPEPVEVVVPAGSKSRGTPDDGRLVDGQRLPDSALYTLKRPDQAYASTSTMAQLQRGIATFRRRTGFEGEVLITAASGRRGGLLLPHLSHQSGRDVDIGLLSYPSLARALEADVSEVDWGATWALIREFTDAGEVEYIFLAYELQKKLYEAARAMGTSEEVLEYVFQYPRGPYALAGVIRHSPGHVSHFHVRWACGPSDDKCRSDP